MSRAKNTNQVPDIDFFMVVDGNCNVNCSCDHAYRRSNGLLVMIAMPRLSPALLLATLVAAPLVPARATTSLTDLQILDQFNAVSFTTFSSASDVEGRTVVGTNLTGG